MSTELSTISNTKVKARWTEPYTSEAIDTAFRALGIGIVQGFEPGVNANPDELVLSTDDSGQSLMLVEVEDAVSGKKYTLAYREEADVVLDVSSFSPGDVIHVAAKVSYTTEVETAATWEAYTDAEYQAGISDSAIACRVTIPGAGDIAAGDIDKISRDSMWRSLQNQDKRSWGLVTKDAALSKTMSGTGTMGGMDGRLPADVSWWMMGTSTSTFEAGATVPADTKLQRNIKITIVGDGAVSQGRLFRVNPGDDLFATWWRNLAAAEAAQIGPFARFLDEDLALVSDVWFDADPPDGGSPVTEAYTAQEGVARVPATAVYGLICVGVDTAPAAGIARIAALKVWAPSTQDFDDLGDDLPFQGSGGFAQVLKLINMFSSASPHDYNEYQMGWSAESSVHPQLRIQALDREGTAIDIDIVEGTPTAGRHNLERYGTFDNHGDADIDGDLTAGSVASDGDVDASGDVNATGDVSGEDFMFGATKTYKRMYRFSRGETVLDTNDLFDAFQEATPTESVAMFESVAMGGNTKVGAARFATDEGALCVGYLPIEIRPGETLTKVTLTVKDHATPVTWTGEVFLFSDISGTLVSQDSDSDLASGTGEVQTAEIDVDVASVGTTPTLYVLKVSIASASVIHYALWAMCYYEADSPQAANGIPLTA